MSDRASSTFGYTLIEGLIDALDCQFDGIADPEQLSLVEGHAREWITIHKRYGFEFHTNHKAPVFAEVDVRKKTAAHFKYLSQVFVENLEDADRIFVYRPEVAGPAAEDARRLLTAMHRFGNATLLWIDVATSPDQVGTVSWTSLGSIMTGYLDRYAKTRFAAGASFECWLKVLAAAAQLHS